MEMIGAVDDERGLLEAARLIRPFLPDLVGPAAAELDRQIGEFLAAASRGENVAQALWSLLASDEVTSEFVTEVLADAPLYRLPIELRPEGLAVRDPGIQPWPADAGTADAAIAGPPPPSRQQMPSWKLLDPERIPSRLTALGNGLGEARRIQPAGFTHEFADELAAAIDVVRAAHGDVSGPAEQAARAEPPDEPDDRFFVAELEDHERGQPLAVGQQYTIAFSVGPSSPDAVGESVFPRDVFAEADQDIDVFGLTVQLDSDDFEIYSDATRPLRVPRTGRSLGKARFEVAPRHDGPSTLVASAHYQGNFVHQMKLTILVGGTEATAEVSSRGRPPGSVVDLKPREISILLEPASAGGFSCTAMGSVVGRATLPIKDVELAATVESARKAMMSVIQSVSGGALVFQDEIDIPQDAQDSALRTLARAGARLYQQLFEHDGGEDASKIGEWLRQYAMDSQPGRTIQIVADQVPLPWAMLYLGDASEGAELDWDNFLGMRRVVEQLPLQKSLRTTSTEIVSEPSLAVSISLNTSIDASRGTTLVAEHQKYWTDRAAARAGLSLVSRSTKSEIVRALASGDTGDQVVYFYCHATAGGQISGGADDAAIIMGKDDRTTLADLYLDAPTRVKLAGNPLVFINACESAELSPLFYNGLVPYFMAKGARGVIGTECKTPARFAAEWADAFFERFLDGAAVGDIVLQLRQDFVREHHNPLGLIYAIHCNADTRIKPPLAHAKR
jgi:hypothetical protein